MITKFISWLKEREQKNTSVFSVVRIAIVVIALLLGGLFAAGSILFVYIEMNGGFMGQRQGTAYVLGYIAQFAASLIVPAILWRLLLPKSARWWWIGVIVGIGVAGVLFGLTF